MGEAAQYAGIAAIISSVLTLLCTKGVDAYVRWRGTHQQDEQYRDQRVEKGYEFVISQLKERTSNLEIVLVATQKEHLDCIRVQAGLKAQNEAMERNMGRVTEENREMKKQFEQVNSQLVELRNQFEARN